MDKPQKQVKGRRNAAKHIPNLRYSSDTMSPVWCFNKLDLAGHFVFNLGRPDFNHREFLNKMISYSNMTWAEIKSKHHDDGKSKHHFLDYDGISDIAKERIKAKNVETDSDQIFSFAFQNRLRIIGIRDDERFYVMWYDPNHEFYPSMRNRKKKH